MHILSGVLVLLFTVGSGCLCVGDWVPVGLFGEGGLLVWGRERGVVIDYWGGVGVVADCGAELVHEAVVGGAEAAIHPKSLVIVDSFGTADDVVTTTRIWGSIVAVYWRCEPIGGIFLFVGAAGTGHALDHDVAAVHDRWWWALVQAAVGADLLCGVDVACV